MVTKIVDVHSASADQPAEPIPFTLSAAGVDASDAALAYPPPCFHVGGGVGEHPQAHWLALPCSCGHDAGDHSDTRCEGDCGDGVACGCWRFRAAGTCGCSHDVADHVRGFGPCSQCLCIGAHAPEVTR